MCGLTCHVIVPHQSQQQGDNSPSPRLCLTPPVKQVMQQRGGIQFGLDNVFLAKARVYQG